jgi:hypothetical protein
VERWLFSGQSAQMIGGELGNKEQSLHKWKQQFTALDKSSVNPNEFFPKIKNKTCSPLLSERIFEVNNCFH